MSAVLSSAFLSTSEAAAYLGLAAQTLRMRRSKGDGPPFIKLGRGVSCRCIYRKTDLEAWLKVHTHGDEAAPKQ